VDVVARYACTTVAMLLSIIQIAAGIALGEQQAQIQTQDG